MMYSDKIMKNIIEVLKSLKDIAYLEPASTDQIKDAEQQLNLKFANEYKNYVSTFGVISAAGIELSGIIDDENLGVTYLTQQERELNNNVPHNMYVVENTHIDGIIIWQDENGLIYLTQYDSKPKQIATSLVDYITNYLKK